MVQASRVHSRQTENTRDKLYIVLRQDLLPGLRAAQACHVLREFGEDYPEIDAEWFKDSNTIVLLDAPDEKALDALAKKAVQTDVPCSVFWEIDLDNSLTALALGPKGKKLVSGLPLAFKQEVVAPPAA